MTDLATLDAVGHAELVRSGEVSPLDLVDAAITRIEKLNPELNAVIAPLYEEAREAARSPGATAVHRSTPEPRARGPQRSSRMTPPFRTTLGPSVDGPTP
jgi:Asp-tRNA(Asn)/Glu-tRNA(Gln) amidotransferase A subunit family amidase